MKRGTPSRQEGLYGGCIRPKGIRDPAVGNGRPGSTDIRYRPEAAGWIRGHV